MTLLQIGASNGLIGISYPFFIRLLIDVTTAFILIRYIYFPIYKTRDYVFLFFIFNLLIFIITHLLSSVNISIGTAFGLFAVFSMLQYRTEKMSVKNMTYIFLLIAIGLINGVPKLSWHFTSLVSVFMLSITYFLETVWLTKKQTKQTEICINLEYIKLHHMDNLIADIEARLGAKIAQIFIKKVDFIKQNAIIDVSYYCWTNDVSGNKSGNNTKNAASIFEASEPIPLNIFELPRKAENTLVDMNGETIQSWIEQKPKEKYKYKERALKLKEEIFKERKKEKRKFA